MKIKNVTTQQLHDAAESNGLYCIVKPRMAYVLCNLKHNNEFRYIATYSDHYRFFKTLYLKVPNALIVTSTARYISMKDLIEKVEGTKAYEEFIRLQKLKEESNGQEEVQT